MLTSNQKCLKLFSLPNWKLPWGQFNFCLFFCIVFNGTCKNFWVSCYLISVTSSNLFSFCVRSLAKLIFYYLGGPVLIIWMTSWTDMPRSIKRKWCDSINNTFFVLIDWKKCSFQTIMQKKFNNLRILIGQLRQRENLREIETANQTSCYCQAGYLGEGTITFSFSKTSKCRFLCVKIVLFVC